VAGEVLELRNFFLECVWKAGETVAAAVGDHPEKLLARHSSWNSETFRLLHRVIPVNVERRMLHP
jgi:hypothetical protein